MKHLWKKLEDKIKNAKRFDKEYKKLKEKMTKNEVKHIKQIIV